MFTEEDDTGVAAAVESSDKNFSTDMLSLIALSIGMDNLSGMKHGMVWIVLKCTSVVSILLQYLQYNTY